MATGGVDGTVGPVALAPSEVVAKSEAACESKVAMPAGRCFVSAMLAGAFIGFGAMFFCLLLGDSTLPFSVQRIGGGLCFCLGLTLVLCCGAELFTGNSLMVCALASRKVRIGAVLRNWGIVWFGNLAGALVAVAFVYLADVQGMNSAGVGEAFVSVAAGKVALEPVTLLFKAIMCNILVCLAVWIGFAGKSVADKVLGILLPISAFVACGFEHCVANMFFLPMGLILNAFDGVGAQGAVTIAGVACNIAIATVGNVIGGSLVGLAYWFAYGVRRKAPDGFDRAR